MKRLFAVFINIFIVTSMLLGMTIYATAKTSVPHFALSGTKQVPTFKATQPPRKAMAKTTPSVEYAPESDFMFDSATGTILKYTGSDPVVDIPDTIGGVKVEHVGQESFVSLGITSVRIPDGVQSIGLGAFGYCTFLTEVSIPQSVTVLNDACFYGCSSLENITLPNKLERIGDVAFRDCTSLKSIIIPNSVKHLGVGAFYWCFALENATISNQLTRIEEFTFELCESMKNITIPDSVTYIGDNAFWGCSAVENLKLSKKLVTIEDTAFYYLPLITSITIPDSVTYIGIRAFMYGENVTSLILSENLTDIGKGAFVYCKSLKNVTIPKKVTTIGRDAFLFCEALESAYFNGNAPVHWGDNIFDETAENFTIYYLSDSTGFTSPTYYGYPCVCLYHVNIASTSGGSVFVSRDVAEAGATVTLEVSPDFGMITKSVYYRDKDGQHDIEGNNFTMPESDVTVGAVFELNIGLLIITLAILFGIIGILFWLLL